MNPNSVDILLVEDNAGDAKLTIRELHKYSLAKKLFHVKDGAEALDFIFATGAYARTRHIQYLPRIVLLDIQMPKLNGMDVLRRLKADPRTSPIPVVILTMSNENTDIRKCYDLGASSYVVKPLTFEGFMQAIEKLAIYTQLMNSYLAAHVE